MKDECTSFNTAIKRIEEVVEDKYKKQYVDLIKNIDLYILLIDLHIQGNKGTVRNVCFFDILNSFFTNEVKLHKEKQIEFFYQDGIDGIERPLDDEEEIRKALTIHDCLPIMSVVPTQLADNAIKYMPRTSSLIVKVIQTNRRKTIEFANYGPALYQDEIFEKIQNPGCRGEYAQHNHIGMGMGLYEVKEIINKHSWLNPNFSIISNYDQNDNNTYTIIEGVPYALFTVRIQFANSTNNALITADDNIHESNLTIVLHDITQIKNKLYSQILEIRNNIHYYSWRNDCNKLQCFLDQVTELLSIVDLAISEDDSDIKQIIGDPCEINLQQIITIKMNNFARFFYSNKNLRLSYSGNHNRPVSLSAGAYILLSGMINTLMMSCPDNTTIEVDYYQSRWGKSFVSFKSEDIDFENLFDKKIAEKNNNSLLWNKLNLYDVIADNCNIIIKPDKQQLDIIA